MKRPVLVALVLTVLVALTGSARASAESEAANERGKAFFAAREYPQAATEFRHAMAIEFQPRYAYNLCNVLDKMGQLDEALAACDRVFTSPDSDGELKRKAGLITDNIYRKRGRPVARTAPPVTIGQGTIGGGEPIAEDRDSAFAWGMTADVGVFHNGPVALDDEAEYALRLALHRPFTRAGNGVLRLGLDIYQAPNATTGAATGYGATLGYESQFRSGHVVIRPFVVHLGAALLNKEDFAHDLLGHPASSLDEHAAFVDVEVGGSLGLVLSDNLILNGGILVQAFYAQDDVRGGVLFFAGLEYRAL
jgi:tetratricopeptide (TPR) repeat protein